MPPESLRRSIRVYLVPSERPIRDIPIYLVPIVFMVILFAIFSRLEGSLTKTMVDLGGVPLQQMPWAQQYIIFVWGVFFPIILLIFPVFYFAITRTNRTALDLFIEAIGLFIFAGVFQDWLVFAFSDTLTHSHDAVTLSIKWFE